MRKADQEGVARTGRKQMSMRWRRKGTTRWKEKAKGVGARRLNMMRMVCERRRVKLRQRKEIEWQMKKSEQDQ